MEKKCSKCGITKPIDEFAANKMGKLGVRGDCKECANAAKRAAHDPAKRSASNKAYYEANKEAVLARTSSWAKSNRDKTKGYSRKWRSENPDKQYQATMSWRRANPEKQSVIDRENDFRRRSNGYSTKRKEVRRNIEQCKSDYFVIGKYLDVYTMELIDYPTIDHVIPLSQGGDSSADNLAITSRQNNSRKRDQSMIMFLLRLAKGGSHAMGATTRTAK